MHETPPPWVIQANAEFYGNGVSKPDSSLARAMDAVHVLEQALIFTPINRMAVIGIGFSDVGIQQSITPPLLYTALSALSESPSCILLDNDPRIRTVFDTDTLYGIPTTIEQRIGWNWLTDQSESGEREVTDIEPRLAGVEDIALHIQEHRVRATGFPVQFSRNLHSAIRLVEADASDSSWVNPRSLQYIDCSHTLQHMSESGRLLALWNISRSLTTGGVVTLRDAEMYRYQYWLPEQYIDDMHLLDITHLFDVPNQFFRIFQKLDGV